MMNLDRVEKIANAVLYEGYILYPYRSTSVKNRQRWNFGALLPQSYSQAQGGTEACLMQTECLLQGDERTTLDVKVRFLHLLTREVGVPLADCGLHIAEQDEQELLLRLSDSDYRVVESLEVGDRLFYTWQEAVEREVNLSGLNVSELGARPEQLSFAFPSKREIEVLRDTDGQCVGLLIRKQQAIEGTVELLVEKTAHSAVETRSTISPVNLRSASSPVNPCSTRGEPQLSKLTVRILNGTALEDAPLKSRDEALMRSLVSTHTILCVRDGGEFISLLEPPEEFQAAAACCQNVGTWPVLVGEEGESEMLLSSPIILYDYPQIAPESAGDLFDGTEIDEILTLRIMTLTEDEKREMRGVDERARRILERTETLAAEQMMKLHGAMRTLHPQEENER
jgi:hypothetical protein